MREDGEKMKEHIKVQCEGFIINFVVCWKKNENINNKINAKHTMWGLSGGENR